MAAVSIRERLRVPVEQDIDGTRLPVFDRRDDKKSLSVRRNVVRILSIKTGVRHLKKRFWRACVKSTGRVSSMPSDRLPMSCAIRWKFLRCRPSPRRPRCTFSISVRVTEAAQGVTKRTLPLTQGKLFATRYGPLHGGRRPNRLRWIFGGSRRGPDPVQLQPANRVRAGRQQR